MLSLGARALAGACSRPIVSRMRGHCPGADAMLSLGARALAGACSRPIVCRMRGHCPGDPLFPRSRSCSAPACPVSVAGRVDRFGAVTVHLEPKHFPPQLDEVTFQKLLQDAIVGWKAEGRVAVWLRVPILQSRFISAAAHQGFTFHHAEKDHSVLALWLATGESRLPSYATHQVGVAGAVFDEVTRKVLVVQDKNKTKNAWKFPGGLSDLGEDIGETAVREVFEETGIRSTFKSLLSIRQQHNHPGAFGKSDLYVICRLKALSFDINFSQEECIRCEWLDLEELTRTEYATPITSRIAKLLLYGCREGFDKIDLKMTEISAIYTGRPYKLYSKTLPEKFENLKSNGL